MKKILKTGFTPKYDHKVEIEEETDEDGDKYYSVLLNGKLSRYCRDNLKAAEIVFDRKINM